MIEIDIKALNERWVEALESGDYEQGNGQLRDQAGRYCCLGVRCEVAKEFDPAFKYAPSSGYYFNRGISDDTHYDFLGLTQADQSRLAWMNDGGSTFQEIAAVIRKDYL